MSERLREYLLLVAVLVLITTAVIEPEMRTLALVFSVVGVALFMRRRHRRLGNRGTRTESD